jgi:ABC-type hemin transport system ATPase subunit
VLLVEHVDEVVARADRAVVLDAGRVIAVGAPADVLADPAVRACYSGPDHPGADSAAGGPPPEPRRFARGDAATSTV